MKAHRKGGNHEGFRPSDFQLVEGLRCSDPARAGANRTLVHSEFEEEIGGSLNVRKS